MRTPVGLVFPTQPVLAMNWFTKFWQALNQPAPLSVAKTKPFNPTPSEEFLLNFTPRAQQALAFARQEADRFRRNFVGTEHLLLGLIKLGQGVAVNVLAKMGLDLETVQSEIEKQVGTGPDQKLIGHIPYTPRVKKVLALAAKEAKALNHTYVGTEHILLGLLREGDGVAALVLKNLEVNIERTRQEILKELDPNFSPSEAETRFVPIRPVASTVPDPSLANPKSAPVDTSRRYDVYCAEGNEKVVVYRNALFKGVKNLHREADNLFGDFYQLEQANGQAVFVAKYSVIKFCEPGTTPDGETVSQKDP
jgi:hypothetical protein